MCVCDNQDDFASPRFIYLLCFNFKVIFIFQFFILSALVAAVSADVSSHATIAHGHGPVVSHAVHAPHHGPAVVRVAPVAHAVHAPVVHAVHAPVVRAHAVPVVHAAPVVPVVHAAPVVAHAAPAYHAKPAAYEEAPEPYTYTYGVADDYSNANFNAAETADANGAVSGSYSVALPDGRTQTVTYTANGYDGYVADVSYEGVPVYPEAKPYVPAKPAYAPAPAYHA